jgi:hypothetical protein
MSFTNPIFLAALAAVGLPVLIHFLTRARPRVIRYPTYHLLVEVGSGRQSVHRLRTFLVLALRTILVAALVLAFARPFPAGRGAAPEKGAERRVALLIDASMSMRAVDRGVSLFTKAQAQAADLLRSLDSNSSAAVILIGAKPVPLLPALSRNIAALHEALAAARPTLDRGDPAGALALAGRMLEGSGEVFVFGDFQRTNWGAVDFVGSRGIATFLRPVSERDVENVGITGIEKSPQEPIEGETVELTCTAFNSTPQKRIEKVRLDLEGISQSVDVELQPYASGSGTFAFSLPRAGTFPGKVAIGGDDLPEDNVRFFKLDVRQALHVLLVSDAAREDALSAAAFIATALAPSQGASAGMKVVRRASADVDRGALETADVFFLVSPVRPSGETVEIIARRAREGAQLVVFLDGPTAPEALSGIAGAFAGAFAPPFTLVRPSPAADPAPLAWIETRSGPLRLFHSPEQADLKGLLFSRHFLTQDDASRKHEVLARFEDGSAALSLSPAGRGTVVLANLPIAPDGSNLAGSPLFPAMVHEIVRALRSAGAPAEISPGEPWTLDCAEVERPREGEAPPHRVLDPEGKEVETAVVARGRLTRLALPPARIPGIYSARQGETGSGVGVVNVHAKETDTRSIVLKVLVDAARESGSRIAVLDDAGDLAYAGKPIELWPHCVAAATGAVGLEMLLLALTRRRSRRPVAAGGLMP